VQPLGPKFRAWLNETALGNDPATLDTLSRFAAGELPLSPAEAQKKLDAIMADTKHVYWRGRSQNSVERQTVVSQVRTLTEIAAENPQAPSRGMVLRGEALERGVRKQAAADQGSARAAANAMLKDRSHPLNNKNAPGHGATVKEWHQLIERLWVRL
jgi:hypothetical protein